MHVFYLELTDLRTILFPSFISTFINEFDNIRNSFNSVMIDNNSVVMVLFGYH